MKEIKNYKDKMEYVRNVILPKLEEAFQRGDAKYVGKYHHTAPTVVERTPAQDVDHIRRCHVDVRLLEAEDAASVDGNCDTVLRKIESAIGYLVLLHARRNGEGE